MTRIKSKLSQPERVQILLNEGTDAPLQELLGDQLDLFDPSDQYISRAEDDLRSWTERGIRAISILDDVYPRNLRKIHEAPAIIYTAGTVLPDDTGVAVVGSRSASSKALANARLISELLVEQRITVVSGLARGIDSQAHISALDSGGRTVAVMGTGLERTYPQENKNLRTRIEQDGGLILTQFEPGSPVTRASFPMRNVTMSGYSVATIVVEASEKSGTRHQARRALMHGRNVILLPSVARGTQWGHEMAKQPGVFVAATASELQDHLERIKKSRELLDF